MFRVEISLSDADRLVETIEAMQAWCRDRMITPATFGYSLAAARTLFRVDFAEKRSRQPPSPSTSTARSSIRAAGPIRPSLLRVRELAARPQRAPPLY